MKLLLRLVAVWFGLGSLVVGLLLLHLGTMGVSTPRAALTWLLLVMFGIAGAFASVQLWRLQEGGRRAAIAVCLLGTAFMFAQFKSLSGPDAARLGFLGLVMLLLLSPSAKRACRPRAQP